MPTHLRVLACKGVRGRAPSRFRCSVEARRVERGTGRGGWVLNGVGETLRRRAHLGLDLALETRPALPGAQLWIDGVDEASPAQRAGLRVGDALLSIAGEAPRDLALVRALVASLPLARPLPCVVQRGPELLELEVCAVPLPLERLETGEVVLEEVPWQGHRLRAVWTFPSSDHEPAPAIWMLPGAAWLSEEHPVEPESARLELVRGFTRAGFATLRVERSGLGDSEGPPCTELDLKLELDAWRAASRHFCAHPRVRQSALFVYGRSLGGMLAPLLASEGPWAALAVWGTSARRWRDGMRATSERQYRLAGQAGAELARKLAKLEQLHDLVFGQGLSPEQAFVRAPELRDVDPVNFQGRYAYGRVAEFFRQLDALDLQAAWRRVACPVLALHGSSDWLSFAEDSRHIAAIAPRGMYRELRGIDHMMHARPTVEAAFAEPWGGVFNPAALEAVVSFFRGFF